MRRILTALLLCAALLLPNSASADNGDDEDFSLRVNGDYHVLAGESVDTLMVISGDVVVDGAVNETLVVIEGRATVNGTVGDMFLIRATADLQPAARVGDITLIRSDLNPAPGAVTGSVERTNVGISRGWAIAGSIFAWVGMTVLVLASGFVFARVGGRQLGEVATHMSENSGATILTGIVSSIVFPLVGVLALITVVGIPLGLTILFVVIPIVMFLGYLVAGAWLGFLVMSRPPTEDRGRPYGPVLLGLLILQIVVLIPGFGWAIFLFGAVWGGGAVVHRLRTGPPEAKVPPPAVPEPAPPVEPPPPVDASPA